MKLGDLVEKFTYITGIKYIWEKIHGGPCEECRKRKEYLNRLNSGREWDFMDDNKNNK
jgi:hypothetical protein